MATTPIIQTNGLTKLYKDGKSTVKAIDNLTMSVPDGSIFGFLGPNGSGKSTTIRMLVGLAHPTQGDAEVAGSNIKNDPNGVRAHVGYLAQSPLYYNYMTGRETLEYVAGFYPWVTDPLPSRVNQLLGMVGLDGAGDRKVGGYSGGMKQRLGIAQALVGRPKVVILDEPVSALDPIGRHEVLEIMRNLRGQTTIMFSTHILDDVQRVADYVAVLDHGKLITQAATGELLGRYTQNDIDVVVQAEQAVTPHLEAQLSSLPSVAAVTVKEVGNSPSGQPFINLVVLAKPGAIDQARREIQRTVTGMDLLLQRCEPLRLDLESVFLKLVN